MKHSAVPLSIRLPDGANTILSEIVKKLNITKGQFLRDAVMEKIEDAIDIATIEDVLAKNEPTISHEELKRELQL
jgi:predicted DNA-binding protein